MTKNTSYLLVQDFYSLTNKAFTTMSVKLNVFMFEPQPKVTKQTVLKQIEKKKTEQEKGTCISKWTGLSGTLV